MDAISSLLISYLFVLLGSIFTHGFYSFSGVVIILVSFVLLIFSYKYPSYERNKNRNLLFFAKFILIQSSIFSLLLYGGLYQVNIFSIVQISQILLMIAFILTLLYLFNRPLVFVKSKFKYLIVIFIIVHFLMIVSSPDPKIDIFRSLKYGSAGLLSLKNPYQEVYPQLYHDKILNYFSYFPTILFYFFPFQIIFGDVRVGIVFAQLLIAFLLYRLFKKNKIQPVMSQILILIFLYFPLNSYITEQSFVDVIIVLGIILLFYYVYYPVNNDKFLYLSSILLMNTKQIFFVLTPLFLFRNNYLKDMKSVIKCYFFSSLLSLPFFLWSWRDFLYDTVLIYFQPPQGVSADASLNIRSLLVNFFHITVNQNIFLILAGVLLLIVLYKSNSQKNSLFRGFSIFFLGFFIVGSIAYMNHYYLAASLILIYICSLILDTNHSSPAKPINKRNESQKQFIAGS